jgi:deoxycytidylate deaminase
MSACLKQSVTCRIVRDDGRTYEATNSCQLVDGVTECPRVTAGCKSGEGYDLCNSLHAEVAVAALAQESSDIPGSAYLSGHTYACDNCKSALASVNVNTIHIVEAQ